MAQEKPEVQSITNQNLTLIDLIDNIQFQKVRGKKKIQVSESDSLTSSRSMENKQKASLWAEEDQELFYNLLKKYGTDFNVLKPFFPGKTKSQLKNKLKQKHIKDKKKAKEEDSKLKAVQLLFKEASKHQEDN